jgi:hypothetical protein
VILPPLVFPALSIKIYHSSLISQLLSANKVKVVKGRVIVQVVGVPGLIMAKRFYNIGPRACQAGSQHAGTTNLFRESEFRKGQFRISARVRPGCSCSRSCDGFLWYRRLKGWG